MKRTKLCMRCLPKYSLAEELVNAISHGLGALMGIMICTLCVVKGLHSENNAVIAATIIYGISIILLYSLSTIYHALRPSTGKKVFQILDHCTIYLMIAGTYTPIVVATFFPDAVFSGIALLALQWSISILAIVLNAIDLKRFRLLSYSAYILLGWAIVLFAPVAFQQIPPYALLYLLLGGISYTIGAILFAIGAKLPWFHSIFHFFVLLGSFLHFIAIYQYILS